MNKSQLKTYAPKARRDFIQMVRQRADVLGLTKSEIAKPEVQGDVAVIEGRPYPRPYAELHTRIAKKIEAEGLDQFLDRTAYSWFNRFAALRYMEVNGYLSHPFRVLSNRDSGKNEPEILEHAAEVELAGLDRERAVELKLAGDRDAELYKLLLIAQCNELHAAMPFLFERVNDESELLLSDNLLRTDSVVRKMVSEIDEENWQQVEIIGWLYQFYISEKKDEVIGKTVKSEDIPAATQLFTPNWIVKYMVQNSLGRLWIENHSESKLAEQMEFYIKPEEQDTNHAGQGTGQENKDSSFKPFFHPGSIKILDPACGSGHILVEAYDLLKAIYTETGFSSRDIPLYILRDNLYGLDIDERAAQMASFALLMKARADDPNILEKLNADSDKHLPNIMAVPDSSQLEYTPAEVAELLGAGDSIHDIDNQVISLLEAFSQGKTLGSLIRIPDDVTMGAVAAVMDVGTSGDIMQQAAARLLKPFVRVGYMLAQKYDCVIANPPYMGSNYFVESLKRFVQDEYENAKGDLYSCFMVRCLEMSAVGGVAAMITIPNWMSLVTFEKLRFDLLTNFSIESLLDNGRGVFGSDFGSCAFVIRNEKSPHKKGTFKRLFESQGSVSTNSELSATFKDSKAYTASPTELLKVPGYPIAYWITNRLRDVFMENPGIGNKAKKGLSTGENERFVRIWFEVSNVESSVFNGSKWFPMTKGGEFRKWYGNNEFVINWENEGQAIREFSGSVVRNSSFYLQPGISWNDVSISNFSSRFIPEGFVCNASGPMIYGGDVNLLLSLTNSKVTAAVLRFLSPTVKFEVGSVAKVPVVTPTDNSYEARCGTILELARSDWDSFETSWDFKTFPILVLRSAPDNPLTHSVEECWNRWNELTEKRITRMQELETENNRLFIDAYGLQDELSPEVPLDQITLARADKEKDTRRLLSYFIGCLMGRYSLDEPGLIYADAGSVGFDALRYKTFPADEDGIVPVTDMEWFPQEAARQFEAFIKVAWGEQRLAENLRWIAEQLSPRAGEEALDTIRRYFSSSFFKDHMQTYKKRPIYWLFSSGKQKAFEALVYLHRYNESTLPRMRQEYVLPLMSKIEAQIETLAGPADQYGNRTGGLIETSTSTSERNKLTKQLETLKKKQTELAAFDEKLRHHADMRITLDLDDGVKVNYGKFGDLLAEVKAIT